MLKTLDSVLFKNTNPVGIKYSTTNLILPPSHFIYGKKMIPDKEDVSIGKLYYIFSDEKLGISFKFKN